MIEEIAISRPDGRLLAFSLRKPSRNVRNTPVRFTSMIERHKSNEVLSNGALAAAPAFAMTMSAHSILSNNAMISASSVTSQTCGVIDGCATATFSSTSARLPVIQTAAPLLAKARAISAPTPVPPPVMRTVFPE